MALTIKFFASLRERMGAGEASVPFTVGMTVRDSWDQASEGADWPDRMLCARNLDYVDPSEIVEDGDEVAFFPPVTGG